MTVLDSGFHPVDSGFRVLDSGFRIPAQWIPDSKKGWIPNFFCFNAFLLDSSQFAFVFESYYIERRCLECISSLFSFSIYKLPKITRRNVLLFRKGLRYNNEGHWGTVHIATPRKKK